MLHILGALLMALAAVLQSAVFNNIRILNGRPDLVLLILICIALYARIRPALIFAFLGGLFLDLLSGLPLGVTSIQLVLVVFVLSFTENRFWQTNILVVETITLAASMMFHLLGAGISLISGSSISFTDAFTRIILPSTFLNLIFILPAAYIARRIREQLVSEDEDEIVPQ